MKKILAILSAIILVVALSACQVPPVGDNIAFSSYTSDTADTSGEGDAALNSSPAPSSENTAPSEITRDRAIEIALGKAGLTRDKVRDLEAELDYERSGKYWEVDFESGGYEYSYDINAVTEEVVRVERDRD